MRQRKKVFLIAVGLALLVALAYATVSTTQYWKVVRDNTLFINDVGMTAPVYIDGALTMTGALSTSADITLKNGETIGNASDSIVTATYDDDAALLGEWRFQSSNTSTAANDYYRMSWYFYDDHAASTRHANIEVICDDVVSSSSDATMRFGVVTADTFAPELDLTGADLSPYANAGLDLGSSSYKWGAAYITSFGANWTNAGRTVADLGTITTVDINGGSIDGVTIGGGTPAAGAFTTITASTSIKVDATNGTAITQANIGTFVIDDNTTGTSVSLTGCTADTRVIVAPIVAPGAATMWYATPGSGSFIGKIDQDANKNITMIYIAFK